MEYKGIGISSGISLGRAVVLKTEKPPFQIIKDFNKENEIEKISFSISTFIKECDKIIESDNKNVDVVSLTKSYKMIVSDPFFYEKLTHFIIDEKYSAIKAIDEVLNHLKNNDSKKVSDINNVKKELVKNIIEIKNCNLGLIDYDFILVSKEITTEMLLSANPKYLKGIISEIGSKTSHVAIFSRNMEIPYVFNISEIDSIIKNDEIIYLNGKEEIVVNELKDELIKNYKIKIGAYQNKDMILNEILNKKAETVDGKNYKVTANTENPDDLEKVIEVNADGIGLFRSEFLYLNNEQMPSEDWQFNIYKKYTKALKNKPFIIRTIDICDDKKISFFNIPAETNPFLGYRAIRYCIDHKEIFKTQLRAILRASNYGNIMIMYPMISSLEEIYSANAILRETMAELDEEEVLYNENIKVGIMIEVPSTAIIADMLIEEVDFFSIGTNDLVQYTMAVDRTNPLVNKLYDAFNPSVIRLLKNIVDSKKNDKFISVCGETACDPLYIIILVGLGVDELSVNINSVLKVKKYISLLNYEECKKVIGHILTLKTGTKIKKYLENYAKEVFNIYLDL